MWGSSGRQELADDTRYGKCINELPSLVDITSFFGALSLNLPKRFKLCSSIQSQ